MLHADTHFIRNKIKFNDKKKSYCFSVQFEVMLVVNALAYSPKLRKFVSRSPAVSCIVLSMHWIRIDCGHHIICHVSVTIHMINGTLISSALYAGPPHWFRIIRSANIYIYTLRVIDSVYACVCANNNFHFPCAHIVCDYYHIWTPFGHDAHFANTRRTTSTIHHPQRY